ncbi:MAG: putative rane protein [Herbinix sp.]|nr:putative rane protein [Herbinix sp.]
MGIGVSRMIETIYSNETADLGRSNKVQGTFKMPKNIRQIGKTNAVKKIYVEDYVMSYIKQLANGEYSGYKIAVLLGQCIRLDNCRNIFISGAVEVKDIDSNGEIAFSNEVWTNIYEDIKKYFVEAEIVGWFVGGPGYLLDEEDKIQKIHIDNFAGQDKVLLTYDNMEKEENFFSYESGRLGKQEGYYIYYEKNEEMQNYMIEQRQEQSSEADYEDKVSKDIRTILEKKKEPEEDNKNLTRLMYAAGTLLAVIILVVGAAILSNYDQMKSMQKTMDYLTNSMQDIQTMFTDDGDVAETSSNNTQPEDKSLDVVVVPGEVSPLNPGKDDTEDSEEVGKDDQEDKKEEVPDSEKPVEDNTAKDQEDAPADDSEAEEAAAIQKEVKYYVVKTGDTLADVSFKLYNTYTKVKEIMRLNNMTHNIKGAERMDCSVFFGTFLNL